MKHLSEKDFDQLEHRDRVRLINSIAGFKPSNLLATINSKGETNLSIISSVFHLGADPALLGFIIRPDSVPRHSLNNIRETKIFTLNHVNDEIFKQAHQTSARYPEDVSEFDACDLTEEYLKNFKTPFVKESRIKIACELIREVDIPENGTHMIIAKILSLYLPEEILNEDCSLNLEQAGTITVSGLDTYYLTKKIARLSYAKPDKNVEEVD